jgi:hypothetical protein
VFYVITWTKLDPTCICFLNCFKFLPSICSSWIDHVYFLYFFGSVRFTSAQLASSPPFPLPDGALLRPTSPFVASCHTSFTWSQDELAASALSSDNALSCRFPLEPKLKHWIRTTAAGHPPHTVWLSPSTAIACPGQLSTRDDLA